VAQVSLKSVSKSFPGNVWAIRDIDLKIENKEFIVFVGPSGCGKSTTLRIIAGLEEATSGDVYIGDRLVNDVLPKDRNIAMVFQNYALYPHMSVYDNMAFGLKLRKYPKAEIDTRVKEAAVVLDIEKLLHRKPRELSGGQRQRVAVGRSIVRKPLVFLFDEPLSNLDAKMRVQMRTEIKKLHIKLQTTMIYVTHDQTEAMTMGDRIVVMKDGVIQQIADPIKLYDKPVNKFVAGFIGSPPMNFVKGVVIKKESRMYFNEGRFNVRVIDAMTAPLAPYVNKEVILGIRPEDMHDKLFVSDAPQENTIRVVCEVIEPIGSEAYLYLNTGKNPLVARVDGHSRPTINQDMDMVLDMSKVHFFDKDTDITII